MSAKKRGAVKRRAPSAPVPQRLSPLHERHVAMGAQFKDVAGWRIPHSYGDPAGEQRAATTSGVLCDLTAQARFILRGEAAADLAQAVSRLDASSRPGAASRAVVRDSSGGQLSEGWLLRLRPDTWWLSAENPAGQQAVGAWLGERSRALDCVHSVDVTGGYATFGLCGPCSLSTLQKLLAVDPDKLAPPRAAQTRLGGVLTITLHVPAGKAGDAWLVTCPRESAEYLWDVLEDAGSEYGVMPAGTDTWEAVAPA
jgi:aminomethyltransferase